MDFCAMEISNAISAPCGMDDSIADADLEVRKFELIVFLMEQGCQFSDFSLISDFLRIKETGIILIKYGQNIDKISIVSKDRLDIGKWLDNPSLNTVSKHQNKFRLSSD